MLKKNLFYPMQYCGFTNYSILERRKKSCLYNYSVLCVSCKSLYLACCLVGSVPVMPYQAGTVTKGQSMRQGRVVFLTLSVCT